MDYFKGFSLNKAAILDVFTKQLDEIGLLDKYNSRIDDEVSIELTNKKGMKRQNSTHFRTFCTELLREIKDNTPYDKNHFKKYKPDVKGTVATVLPHLRDSIMLKMVNDSCRISTAQPYASLVHNDIWARHPIGRAGYMYDVALEVSAKFGNPYDIYFADMEEDGLVLLIRQHNDGKDIEKLAQVRYGFKLKSFKNRNNPELDKKINDATFGDVEISQQELKRLYEERDNPDNKLFDVEWDEETSNKFFNDKLDKFNSADNKYMEHVNIPEVKDATRIVRANKGRV